MLDCMTCGFSRNLFLLSVMVHAFDFSTQKTEGTEALRVCGQPGLYSKFSSSQDCKSEILFQKIIILSGIEDTY